MKYYPGFRGFDLFDDFFDHDFDLVPSRCMKTDITEKDGNYHLDIEVPGIKKENIQLELKNGFLKITANRNTSNEEKDDNGKIIRQERMTGSYSRSFYVGDQIQQEDIKASFDKNCMLRFLLKSTKKLKITQPFLLNDEIGVFRSFF